MATQRVENLELFSEAELEALEFLPEELEAIEAERVPDLDSISLEDIAEDVEAVLEGRFRDLVKKVINKIRSRQRPQSPPPPYRPRPQARPAGQAPRPQRLPSYHSPSPSPPPYRSRSSSRGRR